MVLVQMFGYWIWVHFDMREFGLVPLEVYLEIALCRKPAAANVAFEWSFASM